jgi:outer membrane protein TolC
LRTSLGRNHSVSTVHNAYWDLVYATEAVDSARQSLALATRLVEDNTRKVEVGTLAKIDITSAQAAAAQRNHAIIQAENNRRTLELSLKRLIVTGTDDPNWLATIDPIDRPEFRPASTDLATAIARARRIDPLGTNDITGAAITLGQAAESIQAAQATRERSQQRLETEQKRFDAGLSTNYAVVQAQRELSETRLSELRAVLDYRKAQVEFDRLQETVWNVTLPVR